MYFVSLFDDRISQDKFDQLMVELEEWIYDMEHTK